MGSVPSPSGRKLELSDIADLRAYERERDEFRSHVIALKKRRRVHVGPIVTLVFENRTTVRFQIQEMARVEKIITDEGIQGELDAYNPLIPEPGQLSATLFIELTNEDQLRNWLPKLLGIERAVAFAVGEGSASRLVTCVPEESHAEQLTREEATASVHYIRFEFGPDEVNLIKEGEPLTLGVRLPSYDHCIAIPDQVRLELLSDLQP